ncbi:hypothetical protein BX264_5422 [Streptomyces sp. 2333.5]|nr:hypothetical protein BX264_5422 [Streptomyces sp. 2333.5]SEE65862.1 hypothetical protein SAMN05428943_5554 [Streptomyces sp. 2314.4]SEE91945.1 hypothetical protein SAMN05428942_5522 [Streptomyces sp. 2112.2]
MLRCYARSGANEKPKEMSRRLNASIGSLPQLVAPVLYGPFVVDSGKMM